MPNRVPAWAPRVLAESVLIVFSVLLALALDEWRQGRRDRDQAATARTEIVAELRANRERVAESLAYHSTLLDSIAGPGAATWRPRISLFSRGFIFPAPLAHTAWSSAAETGALSHLDYPTVLRLSRVYGAQDQYLDQSRGMAEILYSALYQGGSESIVANYRNLGGIISTFRFREAQLIQLYDETLGALGAPAPAAAPASAAAR